MPHGIRTRCGEMIDHDELLRRLSKRGEIVKMIAREIGPTSLRDLAGAVGVNRQTIMNALNASPSRKKGGRPPEARLRLADSIDEVLPVLSGEAIAANLRRIAGLIEARP